MPRERCISGDSNAIKLPNKRKGIRTHINFMEMNELGGFIADMELTDLPTIGRKFSWFNTLGNFVSRLDIFFIS